MALKLILGLVGLAVVLAAGFYLWLVYAFTPPHVAPSTYTQVTEQQGILAGDPPLQYILWWEAAAPEAPRTYRVALGPTTDDLSAETALTLTGSPVPIAVERSGSHSVTIHFSAPLADGSETLTLTINDSGHCVHPLTIHNGAASAAAGTGP